MLAPWKKSYDQPREHIKKQTLLLLLLGRFSRVQLLATPWTTAYQASPSMGFSTQEADIALPKNVRLVKAIIFPVVMYGCESWTIKKAECQRIDFLNYGVGEDS